MRAVKEGEKREEQKIQEKGPGIEKEREFFRLSPLEWSYLQELSSFCIILADAPLSPVGHLIRQAHFPPYTVRPGGCFKAEIIQGIYNIA